MSLVSHRTSLLRLRLCRPVVHMWLIVLLFWWAVWLRKYTDLIPGIQLRIPVLDTAETMLFAVWSAVLFFVYGLHVGIYELHKPLHTYYSKFLRTRGMWFLLLFATAYLWFGYLFVSGISRFVIVWAGVWFLVLWTVIDRVRNSRNNALEIASPYRISLVGDDKRMCYQVIEQLASYPMYTIVWQYMTFDDRSISSNTEIVIVVGQVSHDELQRIADTSRIRGMSLYHISDLNSLDNIITTSSRVWPLLALAYNDSPLTWWWRVIKRCIDLVWSVVWILVCLPLFCVVAILIKIDSPGPVFYVQPRVGKWEKQFMFVKFRSMYTHMSVWKKYGGDSAWKLKKELMDSDANVRKGELQKIENDPRVTRVWRFLRSTSIDELPNLFSVLRGDMSLVWPRPHEPFEVARYQSWHKRLLSVKPWIVGYAQLYGRDTVPFSQEAKLDLYYIQHWSLLMDMYVLINTVKVVLGGR